MASIVFSDAETETNTDGDTDLKRRGALGSIIRRISRKKGRWRTRRKDVVAGLAETRGYGDRMAVNAEENEGREYINKSREAEEEGRKKGDGAREECKEKCD